MHRSLISLRCTLFFPDLMRYIKSLMIVAHPWSSFPRRRESNLTTMDARLMSSGMTDRANTILRLLIASPKSKRR